MNKTEKFGLYVMLFAIYMKLPVVDEFRFVISTTLMIFGFYFWLFSPCSNANDETKTG